MKMKPVLFFSILLIVIQAAAGISLLGSQKESQLDMAAVNEIIYTVSEHWEELQKGEPLAVSGDTEEIEFTIIAGSGRVLWAANPNLPDTIYEAAARRDTILDIPKDSQNVGKLIIHNQLFKQTEKVRRSVFSILAAVSVLELILVFSCCIYLNKSVFEPFKRLRNFAVRVAGGDLDFPLLMDRKNVFGAFTESFDLMREELKKARIREREANQSKKELVAKLSHDIKTPVASILAVSELMAVSAEGEKESKQLSVIHEKAEQIDRLITDLFHAALEELQELTVSVSEYSSQVLAELLAAADYQNRAVVEEIPECMLVFDRMRLQQVFDNIFSNSYKYADSDMSVSFAFAETGLVVSICDYGPGAEEEELPLLPGKFYRGKNSGDKNGSGLGLFISQYLMTKMGGEIACRNTENGFCADICISMELRIC